MAQQWLIQQQNNKKKKMMMMWWSTKIIVVVVEFARKKTTRRYYNYCFGVKRKSLCVHLCTTCPPPSSLLLLWWKQIWTEKHFGFFTSFTQHNASGTIFYFLNSQLFFFFVISNSSSAFCWFNSGSKFLYRWSFSHQQLATILFASALVETDFDLTENLQGTWK